MDIKTSFRVYGRKYMRILILPFYPRVEFPYERWETFEEQNIRDRVSKQFLPLTIFATGTAIFIVPMFMGKTIANFLSSSFLILGEIVLSCLAEELAKASIAVDERRNIVKAIEQGGFVPLFEQVFGERAKEVVNFISRWQKNDYFVKLDSSFFEGMLDINIWKKDGLEESKRGHIALSPAFLQNQPILLVATFQGERGIRDKKWPKAAIALLREFSETFETEIYMIDPSQQSWARKSKLALWIWNNFFDVKKGRWVRGLVSEYYFPTIKPGILGGESLSPFYIAPLKAKGLKTQKYNK